MKNKILFGAIAILLAVTVTTAFAASDVMLLHMEAENIEPTTGNAWGQEVSDHTSSTTAYGSILDDDGNARLVWDTTDENPYAYVTLTYKGSARKINIRHLDGIADDSFNVYVVGNQGQEILIDSYSDQGSTETWETSDFSLEPAIPHLGHGHSITIKIEATGDQWSGFDSWGQLAIDWIEIVGNGKMK